MSGSGHTHTAHCTLHPPARGHQENFFPIPSLFVEEKCGKQSWKCNSMLNEGRRMLLPDLSLSEKKSYNPITKSPLPIFISDKLNVSGQIIYFLYWKLTHRKITKLGFSKNIWPLMPFLFLVILHLTKWSLEAFSEIGSFWNSSSSSITCSNKKVNNCQS